MAFYAAKFIELARFVLYVVSNKPTRSRKFLHGLKPNIRTKLGSLLLTQYLDIVNHTLVIEQDVEDF